MDTRAMAKELRAQRAKLRDEAHDLMKENSPVPQHRRMNRPVRIRLGAPAAYTRSHSRPRQRRQGKGRRGSRA